MRKGEERKKRKGEKGGRRKKKRRGETSARVKRENLFGSGIESCLQIVSLRRKEEEKRKGKEKEVRRLTK